MEALTIESTIPMMHMVSPAVAIPRLLDFNPFTERTRPTTVIGRPNKGINHANKPIMPSTSPAVAFPVGFSVEVDGMFSIV